MAEVRIPSEEELNGIIERGRENIYPSKEFLKDRLLSGEQLSLYLGIDPTGPFLHIGHAINLMLLRRFQQLGHKVILLVGDFTAMIGDPTDKTSTRVPLTREQVLKNCENYKEQASILLDFDRDNPCEFRFNSEWHDKLSFEDILHLSSNFTVQQMLERDMFANRMKEGKPINLTEFMYPLMQGYDCVAMEVDGEIGGNDQTFNMLAGRTMMKAMKQKEKFVITNKLLTDTSGKKMGKSEGNIIALTDDHNEIFGKILSWTDGMIFGGFELCTEVSDVELEEVNDFLEKGGNPKEMKIRLAKEIVKIYHGEEKANEAEEYFNNTFAKKELDPESFPTLEINSDTNILDALVESGVESKKQARRLVDQGAVRINEEQITDQEYSFSTKDNDLVLQVGKKKFYKLVVC